MTTALDNLMRPLADSLLKQYGKLMLLRDVTEG